MNLLRKGSRVPRLVGYGTGWHAGGHILRCPLLFSWSLFHGIDIPISAAVFYHITHLMLLLSEFHGSRFGV